MSFWQKLKSGVKKFFGIGGGSSGGSRRSSGSRSSSSSDRASRVSNYGGGGSRSYSDYSGGGYRSDYESYQQREARQRKERKQRQENVTNKLASISKRTDALATGRSSSPAASATTATSGNGTARVLAKLNEKGKKAPPDPKQTRLEKTKTLKQIADDAKKDRAEFNKATGNKYNVDKNGTKARIAQKSQAYDVKAEKYETEKHPIATSFGRGAVSGVTFGGSELLAQTSKNRRKSGAEAHYQKNKSKGAEITGEVAGSLVGFGLTGQASTKLASKVAPKMLKEGGEAAAKRLAKSAAFRTAAKKEAERTGIKVTEEVLERFANQRARRLVNAVGADMAINATTGLGMDVSYAGREALDENGNFDAGKFARNYATNRALSYGLGGLLTVAPALRTSRGILRKGARADALDLARRITAEPELERFGRHVTNGRAANALSAPRIGEAIDDTIARRATQSAEMNAVDRQMPQMRQSMRNAFAQNADDARRVDMNEVLAQNSPFRPRPVEEAVRPQPVAEAVRPQVDEAAEAIARNDAIQQATADARRAVDNSAQSIQEEALREVKRANGLDETAERMAREADEVAPRNAKNTNINEGNAQRTELVPREEAKGTGERTEFRRGNEETAREQARNKRTTNNRQSATQETFDKDFEAFERRVSESQSRAEDLRQQIRSASSEEEKTALKSQLDELNAEIRREFNKASMRYHPDRGGSNEWMRQFNDVYDSYKRGSYKSRKFSGAESSQRAGTGARAKARERYRAQSAGGNGNTPPPPRGGASEAGERGFKKPQGNAKAKKPGRVMDSVEDIVNKRHEKATPRENITKMGKSVRTQITDSLAAFEDVERATAKAEGRQVDHGATDMVRRSQAIANRSTSNKQLKWNGDEYSGTVKRVGADGKTYEIENGTSLASIFKGMDEQTEKEFNSYLLLRHAPDRIREGKPIFDETIVKSFDGSGREVDLNDAKACLEEAELRLKKHPEFAEKAEQIYQYTQNELKNRVDAGLLTNETLKEWNKKYPNYVPTARDGFNELHGVSGNVVGADGLKAAKGSDLDIRSIRDQLQNSTTRNWRDMTTNYLFRQTFGDRISTELAKQPDGGLEMVLDNTINLAKAHDSGKYYADVYIQGKKHRVEIEERFYEALKDHYKNGRIGNALFDTTNEAFSKVASVWKNLITEWSPIFMVKNGMRDFPEAIINSKQTKEFLSVMPDAMRDLMNGGPCSTALRNAGISQSSFIDLDKAIRTGKDKNSLLARMNGAVEMYPRLCEYMGTLKKAGIDITDAKAVANASIDLKARAAANAADVTVNFGRSGSVGKALNRGLVPFFNPSVQGWSKFVRNITEQNLKSPEGVKLALSFAVKATALGAGAHTISNVLCNDNPNYQQISARDKATNYIIPIGDKDTTNMFIKIPSSRFAAVYGLPVINLQNKNKMGWAEMLKVANDQVAPIDPLESTLFSPFLAAKNNKTWYGTPIVSGSMEDLPPSEQYDANTSWFGKTLGKATQNLPKELQISPKKADYIIDAETGVIGDFLLPATTPSRQGGGKGIIGKAGPAVLNVPKRAFTIDSTTQNDLSTRFYDRVQDATTSSKSAKATPKDAAELKRLNAYKSEISTLTTAMRDLQAGDRATKQEDIRGLQEVRNKMMQDALDGKKPPSSAKAMDAVQKYVGTSYAIDKFGSSADKEAMKVYGASVYGDISEKELAKKIDADKDFYKGVRAVGQLEDKLAKATGNKNVSNLSKAVALAEVGASDELFGAYEGTKKSRTETDIKMNRARDYISEGGSTKEFVKLEKARKTLGKLSDYDKEAELDSALADLKSGKINEAEYYQKQGEIKYNANISYVGLATSLAQANAPSRGYVLYDIKAKNVQKGINLAAMGFTARDYREMAKAVDADGNGYPKKQEIIDYVNSRDDIEDKATLYDALYYYKSSYNPFGTPTNYTREQASEVGKSRGVEQISDEKGALKLKDDESSKKSGYRRRYGRRRWRRRRWRRGGGSGKAKVPKPKAIKESSLKKGEALGQKKSSSSSSSVKVSAPKLERVKAKIDLPEAKW